MSLESEMLQAETQTEKIELAREGIRAYIDDNTISLVSKKQVSLMDYGAVCWALGYLGSLAKDEAERMDKERGK